MQQRKKPGIDIPLQWTPRPEKQGARKKKRKRKKKAQQ